MVAKVTRVEQVRFPKSKDVAAEKKLLAELSLRRWQANKDLNEYEKALKAGGKELKSVAHGVVNSFPIKFTNAIIQNKRLPLNERATLVELEQIAHDLRPEKQCEEPVPVHAKMKPNGDFRAIANFGYAHRTAQTVGRRMLERHVVLRDWQYDFRGPSKAIAVVREAILAGKTAIAIVDIKNFNGSFDDKALREELPVPVRMADYYLVGRYLKFVPVGTLSVPTHALLSKARSGISHGSSASPIIGAHTVSKLSWHPTPDIVPVGYVDDLLLAGVLSDVVGANAKAVCAAIAALPTGNFVGVVKWMGDASEGFDYLGVHIRLGTKLEIHPAKGRLEEFKLKLAKHVKAASVPVAVAAQSQKEVDRPPALQAVADAWQYAQGWLAAYQACDEIEAYREMAFAPLLLLLSEIGCGPKNLKPYMSDAAKGGYPG